MLSLFRGMDEMGVDFQAQQESVRLRPEDSWTVAQVASEYMALRGLHGIGRVFGPHRTHRGCPDGPRAFRKDLLDGAANVNSLLSCCMVYFQIHPRQWPDQFFP